MKNNKGFSLIEILVAVSIPKRDYPDRDQIGDIPTGFGVYVLGEYS